MSKVILVVLLVLMAVVLLLAMLALGYSRNWSVASEAIATPTSGFPTLGPLDTLGATPVPTATASRVPTNTPTFIPVFTTTPGYYPLTFISKSWDGMTDFGGRSTGRLSIDANGNVSYEVENPVAHKGKWSVKLSPRQMDELVAAIRDANVFAMEDEYVSSSCCDSVKTTLSIMLNGRIKNIVHRGKVPMALDELERKINEIVFPPPPTRTPTYHDLSIKMTEGGGPGGYSYRFEIDGNGNVSFEVLGGLGNPLKVPPQIGPQRVEELVAAIRKANVFALKDEYSGSLTCMDCGGIVLSITLNGQSKNIAHYGDPDCSGVGVDAAPKALCELERKINEIVIPPLPTTTPYPSNAAVLVTVYKDANGDGTPQPSEGMGGKRVLLLLPGNKVIFATTTATGQVQFDLSGYETGAQLTVTLPELNRSYMFYLPRSGTVPIQFNMAH